VADGGTRSRDARFTPRVAGGSVPCVTSLSFLPFRVKSPLRREIRIRGDFEREPARHLSHRRVGRRKLRSRMNPGQGAGCSPAGFLLTAKQMRKRCDEGDRTCALPPSPMSPTGTPEGDRLLRGKS